MVQNCLKARSLLSKLGVEVTVADARFCKPLDIKLIRQLCENHAFLITVEEGSIEDLDPMLHSSLHLMENWMEELR